MEDSRELIGGFSSPELEVSPGIDGILSSGIGGFLKPESDLGLFTLQITFAKLVEI